MPATVVVGAQWGDEGKGKIVDLLAQRSHLVCRYQGGPNAGHTIVVGRPLIAGDDENSQFTVSVVSASRRTAPPFAVSCFGVAL